MDGVGAGSIRDYCDDCLTSSDESWSSEHSGSSYTEGSNGSSYEEEPVSLSDLEDEIKGYKAGIFEVNIQMRALRQQLDSINNTIAQYVKRGLSARQYSDWGRSTERQIGRSAVYIQQVSGLIKRVNDEITARLKSQ
jgi:hypothetical protein